MYKFISLFEREVRKRERDIDSRCGAKKERRDDKVNDKTATESMYQVTYREM